jgi:hypothetical protein
MVEQAIKLFKTTSRRPSLHLLQGHTPIFLHAMNLKIGGMDRQASELFKVMYRHRYHKIRSNRFYKDLSAELSRVGMVNEANQVNHDLRVGTVQGNFAMFDESDDDITDAINDDINDDIDELARNMIR